MQKIEDYIDSIYAGFGNKKVIRDLKAEMRAHLQEAVAELQAEGHSEQESVELAIERFGDQKQLGEDLQNVLHVERTFAKNILLVALCFLLIGLGTVFGRVGYDQHVSQMHWAMNNEMEQALGDDPTLTSDKLQQLNAIAKTYSPYFYYVAVFNAPKSFNDPNSFPLDLNQAIWVYPNAAAKSPGHGESGGGGQVWYVQQQWNFDYPFDAKIIEIGILFLFGYWILFAVWAVVNSYHQKRFHLLWLVAFALFNVVGYLIYRFGAKRISLRFV